MDLGIIIAISVGTVSIVGVMCALMFWCRTETNAIKKDLSDESRSLKKELSDESKSLREILNEMRLENKDFHFRLLEIERERNRLIKLP
jgi:hypothetical protein